MQKVGFRKPFLLNLCFLPKVQGLETNQASRTHCCVHGMSFKDRCISAGGGATAVAFLCIRLLPSPFCLWRRGIAGEGNEELAEVLSWEAMDMFRYKMLTLIIF